MNTRFLTTFCAIAEAGSVAAAARQLNLATASVSEQMRSLEKEVGAALIMRQGRGIVLTEAGQAILQGAKEILAQVDDLRHAAQVGRLSGQLRIGAISTALITIMPLALRRMAERHPGVEIKVVPGTSALLYRMLENGDLDCALAVEPPFTLPKGLGWEEVRKEPLTLVAPAAVRGTTVEEVLQAMPLIRMDRDAWTGRLISAFLADHNLRPRELFELDAQEAIVMLVAQGLGVTLLPDWGITSPSAGPIRKLAIPSQRYARSVGLTSRRGGRDTIVGLFTEALRHGL
ncbi:LysR substrate-binding domain-containing protein [Roseomonas xinghualingensis]|uniref:LysR substrate-binding domain-containing protein n=1 Tax=Roseomonas xinghualingensis TaxID=2986475 RepID=UPI0021F21C56|nr:LysR substrate-binding domain-containing protein [Roseomonas sp. SXEYE001]MCV4208683.1 LysR substrate-binding domain-containing protein [Roseomonas sp. SXEYE001]